MIDLLNVNRAVVRKPSTFNARCWTCHKVTEVPIGCRVNPCPTCGRHTRMYHTDRDRFVNTGRWK